MADPEKNDHLMRIIDQLDVKTISAEALSLLASMADSIRSVLEKGQYLEQLILNQKNKAIANRCKAVELLEGQSNQCQEQMNPNLQVTNENIDCERTSSRKKKKKKKNKSPVFKDKDDSSSQVHETSSQVYETNLQVHETCLQAHVSCSQVCETCSQVHETSSQVHVTPSLEQNSFQMESEMNQHIDKNIVSNVPLSNNFSNPSMSNNNVVEGKRPLIKLVKLSRLQEDLSTSEEEGKDLAYNIKREAADSSETNFPSKSFEWDPILDGSSQSSHENEKSPSHHEDQLLMPTPIFIKSELQCPPAEQTSPKLILNISEPNVDKQLLDKPISDLNTSGSKENEGSSYSKDTGQSALNSDLETCDKINENKIYFTTGAGATDIEIKDVFKDLSIVSCKIIHKNTHTFGFIRFSNENDMKAALSLSCKFVLDGKELFVRPCFQDRNRNPPNQSNKELPFKRPSSSMQDLAVKRQKFSSAPNDSSPGYPNDNPQSLMNLVFPGNQTQGNTSDSNVFHREEQWSERGQFNDRTERNTVSPQFRRGRGRGHHFKGKNRGRRGLHNRSYNSRTPHN